MLAAITQLLKRITLDSYILRMISPLALMSSRWANLHSLPLTLCLLTGSLADVAKDKAAIEKQAEWESTATAELINEHGQTLCVNNVRVQTAP